MGNWLKIRDAEFNTPVQNIPSEFYVGKKWRAAHVKKVGDKIFPIYNELQIVAREKITVPAGEFDTFKIQSKGAEQKTGMSLEAVFWIVPNLNFDVKREWYFSRTSVAVETGRRELISLRQQSVGLL
jgi:hypothetical protein